MKLSIIIPVYNERNTLLKILRKIELAELPGIEKEIILVDDCSSDGTRDILKSLEKKKKYTIFYHEKNYGKGRTVRTGFKHSQGDIVIIQDADLEYNPNNYYDLILPILKNETDVVYGSRFLKFKLKLSGKNRTILPLHYIGNKFLTLLTNILYQTNITDMETGYKVIRSSILKNLDLKSMRFDFEPEITSKLLKQKHKIKEIAIDFQPRGFKEGKKITLNDGLKAAYLLVKYRFFD